MRLVPFRILDGKDGIVKKIDTRPKKHRKAENTSNLLLVGLPSSGGNLGVRSSRSLFGRLVFRGSSASGGVVSSGGHSGSGVTLGRSSASVGGPRSSKVRSRSLRRRDHNAGRRRGAFGRRPSSVEDARGGLSVVGAVLPVVVVVRRVVRGRGGSGLRSGSRLGN